MVHRGLHIGVPPYCIGVALNVLGSVCVNFGTNIMKHAHSTSSPPTTSSSSSSPPIQLAGFSLTWPRGALLLAIGSGLTFASFAFASQSLLAALGTLQFIANVLFSSVVLRLPPSQRVIAATSLIVAGVVITVSFSNHSSALYSTSQLLALYDNEYLLFLEILALALLAQMLTYAVYTNRELAKDPLPLSRAVRPLCFASSAATIGTQSVLQSKCLAEIIKTSSTSADMLDASHSWFVAAIALVFVGGLCLWLLALNEALKLFDGAVIIPLLQVCWTLYAILQGGMFFHDFDTFSARQYAGFFCGLGVVIVGVGVLTLPGHGGPDEEEKMGLIQLPDRIEEEDGDDDDVENKLVGGNSVDDEERRRHEAMI